MSSSTKVVRETCLPAVAARTARRLPTSERVVKVPARHNGKQTEHAFVDLGDSTRVALMITPQSRGPVTDQLREVISDLTAILKEHTGPLRVTSQTVFLRDLKDRPLCEAAFGSFYGADMPVTNYVLQPPCCGAALALEAWSIGGEGVRIQRLGPQTISVAYDSVRWIYCAGIQCSGKGTVYDRTTQVLAQMSSALQAAGTDYSHVMRTWFYLGGITDPEADTQRYKELNRARSDFYTDIDFYKSLRLSREHGQVYPASTGIGMGGDGLVASCVALETSRKDLRVTTLENPQQTPAYAYHPKYSPKSPKFARATALVVGNYIATWVSGTASIVNSESRHLDDIERQTEQTIDNIEKLIAPVNFKKHGITGAGAGLDDFAKIRVYIKRAEDFEKCRAVCAKRFGAVPAIYAVADVCRPELLVEIEGVAFSRYAASEPIVERQ